jgi:multiple antibiotic resistance protein
MLELLKTFIFFFAVIDPIGSIPVYMEATKQFNKKDRRKIAIKAVFIAAAVLIFFIVVGEPLMHAMHITLPAFEMAGGVILFLFALTMVFGGKPEKEKALIKDYNHVTIFPIAIPSIASPGAIMAAVLLTDNNTHTFWDQLTTTLIILLVLLVTGLMLLAAQKIQEKISAAGITLISKVMGLLLAAFAMQCILSGITEYFGI